MILWHFVWTKAIDFDPTDHTLFSNRSLCWLRLGQGEHALSDAKTCRELKSDWPKGCFREGAALRLLQVKTINFPIKSFDFFFTWTLYNSLSYWWISSDSTRQLMLFMREYCLAPKAKSSLMRSGSFETLMSRLILYRFFKITNWWLFVSFFYREAVDAGRKFHGKDKVNAKS